MSLRRLVLPLVAAFVLCVAPAAADKAINQLPNVAPAASDIVPLWHSGATDASTIAQILQPQFFAPPSVAAAVFGGSYGYEFYPGVAGQTPLTISGAAGQTANILNVALTHGGANVVWIDQFGTLNTLAAPNFGQIPTWPGYLSQGAGGTANGVFAAGHCIQQDPFAPRFIAAPGFCITGITNGAGLLSGGNSNIVITNPSNNTATVETTPTLTYYSAGTPSASYPSHTSDSGATPGLLSVVPSGSTNGWRWQTNNAGALTTQMQLTAGGVLSPVTLQPANALGTPYGGTGTGSPTCGTNGTNTTVAGSFPNSCSWSVVAAPSLQGTNFTVIPANQFAGSSFTSGRCLHASSATAIGSTSGDCVIAVTAGSANIVIGGALSAPIVDLSSTPSVAMMVFNAAGTPSTTSPSMTSDGAATPGFLSVVPSGATNGWCWKTNASGTLTTRMCLSASGALSAVSIPGNLISSLIPLSVGGLNNATFTDQFCLKYNAGTSSIISAAGNCVVSVSANSSSIVVGGSSTAPTVDLAAVPSVTAIIFGTAPANSNPQSTTAPYVSQTASGTNLKLVVPSTASAGFSFKSASNATTETEVARVTMNGCYQPGSGGVLGTAYVCGGTGAPSFSAPNGSLFVRYDGASGSTLYTNTSGASTSGTTWTAISSGGGSQVYAIHQAASATNVSLTQSAYTTVATITFSALPTSGGPSGKWLIRVTASGALATTNSADSLCITGATAGSATFQTLAQTSLVEGTPSAPCNTAAGAPTNPLAGTNKTNTASPFPNAIYEAEYANGAAPTFSAQLATSQAANTGNASISGVAEPI